MAAAYFQTDFGLSTCYHTPTTVYVLKMPLGESTHKQIDSKMSGTLILHKNVGQISGLRCLKRWCLL